jgi:hypothetical protein
MAHAKTPPDWGDDLLAAFLDTASDNVLASYVHARPQYDKMVEVDSAYVRLCDHLLNPEDRFAPFLLLQAHASFRAAAGLAMSGQSPQAFMAMRGCLESSLYGFYFSRNPESFQVWLRRHEHDDARRSVKNEFTIRNLKDCLGQVDPDTNAVVAQLYERTIDFGAHPNVAALAAAFRRRTDGERTRFEVAYLTADPHVLMATMKWVVQTGVCGLMIFRNVFSERFDLLGLSESLAALRRDL